MTNYNERLDEVLFSLCDLSYASFTTQEETDRVADQLDHDRAEAKQAITSLIKELVEEAKPEKRTPDYYSDSIDLYSRQCAANSRNKAIDQFEQNLLKALEEL